MPTPARRAISSRLTFSPTSANPALAASISNCRFRALSARGLRAWAVGLRFTFDCPPPEHLQNGGYLRIVTGGSLHFRFNHFSGCSGRAMQKTLRILTMTHSFGATSTADEVLQDVNLSGKRVLVTGVSAGLGVETARALAAHGAEVIGAARNLSKAQDATEPVRA